MTIELQRHRSAKWWTITRTVLLALYGAAGAFAAYTFITAGVIPGRYLAAFAAAYVLVGVLISFLLIHTFKRRGSAGAAKSVAITLWLIMLILTSGAVYAMNVGIGALNSLMSQGDAVTVDTSHSFNVFISGIDTYGDLEVQSRSDVNILATVNPASHTVLLTTIPRDAYVKIALGGHDQYDKLTHAGNYGVESSMQTVANLLETPITAYVRINFSSFIEGIDKLGGVTVYNPTEFESSGVHFPAGNLELNGQKALVFSRERKSLEGGDVDRGRNQQRVIEAVIKKVTSVRSLDEFNTLLDIMSESTQTNVSSSSVKKLISAQLASPHEWTTQEYVVTGKGQTGGLPSYAMPSSQLYMYVLSEESVSEAKGKINSLLR